MIETTPCMIPLPRILSYRETRSDRPGARRICYEPFGAVCDLESPTHLSMEHIFNANLVCVGCGTDWNQHQLSGERCPTPMAPKNWKKTKKGSWRDRKRKRLEGLAADE